MDLYHINAAVSFVFVDVVNGTVHHYVASLEVPRLFPAVCHTSIVHVDTARGSFLVCGNLHKTSSLQSCESYEDQYCSNQDAGCIMRLWQFSKDIETR